MEDESSSSSSSSPTSVASISSGGGVADSTSAKPHDESLSPNRTGDPVDDRIRSGTDSGVVVVVVVPGRRGDDSSATSSKTQLELVTVGAVAAFASLPCASCASCDEGVLNGSGRCDCFRGDRRCAPPPPPKSSSNELRRAPLFPGSSSFSSSKHRESRSLGMARSTGELSCEFCVTLNTRANGSPLRGVVTRTRKQVELSGGAWMGPANFWETGMVREEEEEEEEEEKE